MDPFGPSVGNTGWRQSGHFKSKDTIFCGGEAKVEDCLCSQI